jgi:hypothetical protein
VVEQALVNQINNGGIFRVIVTPADADVSATYAGFSDPNGNPGPTSVIDAQ